MNKKTESNVIGLIHPNSAWHDQSKELCNNPDVVISKIYPCGSLPSWYHGKFVCKKNMYGIEAGKLFSIYGFRPRRMKHKGVKS